MDCYYNEAFLSRLFDYTTQHNPKNMIWFILGSRIIFDDFREAYWWLRHNTPENSKIMSWWDYGYQISSMANRTILVSKDNIIVLE